MFSFLGLYIAERIISIMVIFFQLNPSKYDMIAIIWLVPLSLEDFYIILRYSIYAKQNKNENNFYTLISNIMLTPLLCIISLWTITHQSTQNITMLSFVIVLFFQNYFLGSFCYLFSIDNIINFNKTQFVFQFLKQIILSTVHFLAYLLIIVLSLRKSSFIYFFLAFNAFRIYMFTKKTKKQIQEGTKNNSKALMIQLGIMQFLHILVDQRPFTTSYYNLPSVVTYKPTLYPKMLFFSVAAKFFTFIGYYIHKLISKDTSMEAIDITSLILSIISLSILLSKTYNQIIYNLIKGRKTLEIESIEQLNKLLSQEQTSKVQSKLMRVEAIYFYNFEIKNFDEEQVVVSLLLNQFENCQVFSNIYTRLNISNNNKTQCVTINKEIDCQLIINCLAQNRLLPQINSLKLQLLNQDKLITVYSKLASNEQKVQIIITNQHIDIHLTVLHQKYLLDIQREINHIIIYNKLQSDQLHQNPRSVIYDLHEPQLKNSIRNV